MKIQIALSLMAIAMALVVHAQDRTGVTGPAAAAVSNGAPYLPTVTGPIYEVAPQNTPPPENQDTVSSTTRSATTPNYTPLFERNDPNYISPPQNTPPPTTPGENP